MSLQAALKQIKDSLTPTMTDVHHYFAPAQTDRYIVWMELGESGQMEADNHKIDQTINGSIDLFTKKEFDTAFDQIQHNLAEAKISFSLESVQYEDETKYIHSRWSWEVVNGEL